MENVLSRYSNRTFTLIVQSPKYSNRRITKLTAQLQSNHEVQPESSNLVDSSARVKSLYIQFSQSLCSSARFKTTNRQISKNLVTQQTVQLHLSQRVCRSTRDCRQFSYNQDLQQTDQLNSVKSSATFGTPYRHQLESSKPCKNYYKKK